MDEQQHQEDALLEELELQLQQGHPVQFNIIVDSPGLHPGDHVAYLSDVKFANGRLHVTVRVP